MPTKRPDQLPEGEEFDFEDILMVEKDPNSSGRSLHKAQLRKLMQSALKMDPERLGENAILGLQSKFEWVIAQMEKLSDTQIANIEKYENFNSETKNKENSFITPTPSPSITPSITPSLTPLSDGEIRPSHTPTPTLTPTPSLTPETYKDIVITFNGPMAPVVPIPDQYSPSQNGFTKWEVIEGGSSLNLYKDYNDASPVSFNPSDLQEELFEVKKELDNIKIMVMKFEDFFDFFSGETFKLETDVSGLVASSSIQIKIRLS